MLEISESIDVEVVIMNGREEILYSVYKLRRPLGWRWLL